MIDPLAMEKLPSNILQRQTADENRVQNGSRFWLTEAAGDARYMQPQGGGTAERPLAPRLYEMYFDAGVGLPVWWDGTNWVNATGTAV